MPTKKATVCLVQQGVWDMPMESMPLAAGYLKAMAMAEERLRDNFEIKIINYRGGITLSKMANDMFTHGAPDILACSVFGWNYRTFGSLAETFKQLNPNGWVIFGGTHVANQAARTMRTYPETDVVVNGEGELVFRDLLNAYLDGASRSGLAGIAGISFQDSDGQIVTTAPRDRIDELDIIPSPALTGAIDLTDDNGRFRYDVALMETNRGCPYKCSFCYWGGAVGQRVRAFSRERLRQELELYAELKVHTICLCDANFGLLKIDEEFIDDVIEIRERTGYPRAVESSWAKNKSKVFYNIVNKMKNAGLRSSFTLALQTLDDRALGLMNRRNMKVNEWEDLVAWLNKEQLDCYAELIWGAPGETIESFMDGYDRLAQHVSRIAVYPILLLPNTEYSEKKHEYGIVSVRGDNDDFEYVLAHNTMTFADNQAMQRFLFWSRVLADSAVLRHTFLALHRLGGVTQSHALRVMDTWISTTDSPDAAELRDLVQVGTLTPGPAIDFFYRDPAGKRVLQQWWDDAIRPLLPPDVTPAITEVFRYDLTVHPIYRPPDGKLPDGAAQVWIGADAFAERTGVTFDYDVLAILSALRTGEKPNLRPTQISVDLYYRLGVEAFTTTTNSEEIVHFIGLPKDALRVGETGLQMSSDGPYAAMLRETGSC